MSNDAPLREVFEPLGNRLYDYESKKYMSNNPFGNATHEDYPFEISFPYHDIMEGIGREVNSYDPVEVYNEAKYYAGRVEKVVKSLQRRTQKVFWDGRETMEVGRCTYPVTKTIQLSDDEQERLFQGWKEELMFCYSVLREIMEARSHVIPENKKMIVKQEATPIMLPEKLPIRNLQKHFTPYFSATQSAIFLQYLKDLQVIPSYIPSDIGRLGQFLFGRTQKDITVGLAKIKDDNVEEEDYKIVQALLVKINKEIERGLKSFK